MAKGERAVWFDKLTTPTSSRWFDNLTTADRLTMVRQAHHGKTPCCPEALSLSKGEGQT
jgi:hypothetical protein